MLAWLFVSFRSAHVMWQEVMEKCVGLVSGDRGFIIHVVHRPQ